MKLKELTGNLTFADIVLFSFLILFSFGSLAFIKSIIPDGNTVIVEVDGKEQYHLPLYEAAERRIESAEGHANLEIRDGRVRLAESNCRNQICVKQGWIDKGAIVCLPNRIIIRVGTQGQDGNKIDAVSG